MTKSNITFRVSSTGPDLHLRVLLDGAEMQYLSPDAEPQLITVEIDDDVEQEHLLELVMEGKVPDHTQVDEHGNITEDRVIVISDVCLDEIELGHTFTTCARYRHDYNGTRDLIDDEFYGTMGCNGTVKFPFTTPVYLWLLENM